MSPLFGAGHFFPEEDDKFLDRVRAAVEEEELQAASAASTDAALDAIATAEGSRTSSNQTTKQSKDIGPSNRGDAQVEYGSSKSGGSGLQRDMSVGVGGDKKVDGNLGINLPVEFYHYYHGSSYDMGTLIEVIYSEFSSNFRLFCVFLLLRSVCYWL